MGAFKISSWTIIFACAFCLILVGPAAGHLGHDHGADDGGDGDGGVAPAPVVEEPVVDSSLRSSKLLGNKGGALVVFFLVPFLTCLVPFFVRLGEKVLVYGMLFGVGLFFTLAVEHLIGDSSDGLQSLKSADYTYPLAYCLVVLGYMLTFLMDLIVHAIVQRSSATSATHEDPGKKASGNKAPETPVVCCRKVSPLTADVEGGPAVCPGCPCIGHPCSCARITLVASDNAMLEHTHVYNVRDMAFAEVVLLVIALCFHAIFEGLVIGLSADTKEVWKNTATIIIHKVFEGLALGMSLMVECPTRSLLSLALYALSFAISGPVGISIGMILDRTSPPRTSLWAEAIGNAFAAGVFIFVALNHLLVKGMRPSPKDSWITPFLKWFAVALGFVTTSLVQLRPQ